MKKAKKRESPKSQRSQEDRGGNNKKWTNRNIFLNNSSRKMVCNNPNRTSIKRKMMRMLKGSKRRKRKIKTDLEKDKEIETIQTIRIKRRRKRREEKKDNCQNKEANQEIIKDQLRIQKIKIKFQIMNRTHLKKIKKKRRKKILNRNNSGKEKSLKKGRKIIKTNSITILTITLSISDDLTKYNCL